MLAAKVLIFATAFLTVGVRAQTPAGSGSTTPPVVSTTPAAASLTNEDIVRLNDAGLGDDVIVAKINAAAQVVFRLETDDLIALKKANLSQNVIAAMIKRTGAPAAAPISAPAPVVQQLPAGMPGGEDLAIRLVAKDGTSKLTSMEGHMATTWAYVTVLTFSDFPGLKADVRIRDPHPQILIQSSKSPQGRFFLVRCESNPKDGNRSVKLGRSGIFSHKDFGVPDSDWTIPFDVRQVEPGIWRMDPKQDLKPGEYGLYGGLFSAADLYDFGVDG